MLYQLTNEDIEHILHPIYAELCETAAPKPKAAPKPNADLAYNDINTVARRLVEALFGFAPSLRKRLTIDQKRAWPRLFNATQQLLELSMYRYGESLKEAAGTISKKNIENVAARL